MLEKKYWVLYFLFSTSSFAQKLPYWVKKVGNRFFPSGSTIFIVNDFGAKGDMISKDTKAIHPLLMPLLKAVEVGLYSK